MRRFLGMLEIRAITWFYNNKCRGKAYTLFNGGQRIDPAYFRTRSVDVQFFAGSSLQRLAVTSVSVTVWLFRDHLMKSRRLDKFRLLLL